MPARAPASIDMLQTVIRCFHRHRANGGARVFDDMLGGARRFRSRAMIARMTSLALIAESERCRRRDMRIVLGRRLPQHLRRESCAGLRKHRCRKRGFRRRRGWRCANHRRRSRWPGCVIPCSGSDDMQDALPRIVACRSSMIPCCARVGLEQLDHAADLSGSAIRAVCDLLRRKEIVECRRGGPLSRVARLVSA